MGGNVMKSAFNSGPCSTAMPSSNPPSSEGQSAGKVKHGRNSGQNIESTSHSEMPKGRRG